MLDKDKSSQAKAKKRMSRKESLMKLAGPCSVFAGTKDMIVSCGLNTVNKNWSSSQI